ncbi:MAG TPA: hypothetical protein VJA26_02185, partial [Gammaproteobacteria bacterium]|nr:hypothetical protein [Gammaproteobacteria bacterium]
MRWLLRSLLGVVALGALAILAVAVCVWVLASEQGTAWLIARLQARTAPALTIGRVNGSLLDGLILDDIRVRLARDELDIATMSVSWNALAAWSGVLELEDVRMGPVVYRRLPDTGGRARPTTIDLPIEVRVRDAVAESLVLWAGEEMLVFGETTATARFSDGRLVLEQVATESSGVTLAGAGELSFGESVYLAAEIDWSQPSSEPRLAGRLTVSGDLPVLELHHELAAPFAVVADGELTVGSPPRVDLTLQWEDLAIPGVTGLISPSGRLALV